MDHVRGLFGKGSPATAGDELTPEVGRKCPSVSGWDSLGPTFIAGMSQLTAHLFGDYQGTGCKSRLGHTAVAVEEDAGGSQRQVGGPLGDEDPAAELELRRQ